MKYPEDNFDLETFNKETRKNRILLFRQKHSRTMKIITILIAVASLIVGLFVYDALNMAIEYLRLIGITKH